MVVLFKHPLNDLKETCPGLTYFTRKQPILFCFKHRLIILQYIIQHYFDKQLFERIFNIQLKFFCVFEIA